MGPGECVELGEDSSERGGGTGTACGASSSALSAPWRPCSASTQSHTQPGPCPGVNRAIETQPHRTTTPKPYRSMRWTWRLRTARVVRRAPLHLVASAAASVVPSTSSAPAHWLPLCSTWLAEAWSSA